MPPDLAQEVQRWLAKANDDLRAGGLVLTAAPPLVEDALFHPQQAVEKSIKGFLVWHGRQFRKTHDLREIGGVAIELDATLEPLLRRAARLGPFAGVFRYPTEMGVPTLEEAQEALGLANEVTEAILARLPEDARP